ncbi:MAG TPA: 4-hydroxybenzoate octaprenyltransferase [Gammaproteobacteria bacterium]|nr:4-hydroxybenzoate octaprenyltransferase [Gammaproteobacteria bacterium]
MFKLRLPRLPLDPKSVRAAERRLLDRLRWLGQHIDILVVRSGPYARLMRLDRPIGIWLLLWPTLWALWLATDGQPSGDILVIFVLGTVVMRSAGCIINDFADRNIDPHVARTRDRPLATGEVPLAGAAALLSVLLASALGLALLLNPLTRALAVVGALITMVYPFAKRFVAAPQFVLGLAFSWGVPMAFAAELGELPRLGWLLFIVTVVWVVIYDTQYAMTDREDDLRLGVKSTAILFGELDRAIIGALQLLLLLGLLLVGRSAGRAHWYLAGLAAAAVFMLYQQYLIRNREPARCFAAFLNNSWLGLSVLVGLILDFIVE